MRNECDGNRARSLVFASRMIFLLKIRKNICINHFFFVTLRQIYYHTMIRITKYVLLLVAIVLSVTVSAAPSSKHSTLTRKYKDARLETVINEIAKRTDYTLHYDVEDIDAEARVTATFKDASARSAYKKILGKDFDIIVKKNDITLRRKPLPPTIIDAPALSPSRVEEDSLRTITIYEDTTYSISCKKVTQPKNNENQSNVDKQTSNEVTSETIVSHKGHYMQALIGLGYGSLNYHLRRSANTTGGESVGNVFGNFAGTIQLQYAYYFHENWGVTAGIGLSGQGSKGILNTTKQWNGQLDSDAEKYNHIATTQDWTERQIINLLDFPIGVQCQYPINRDDVRIYAGTGLRIGIPVASSYALQSGSLRHTGEYPQWNMLMTDGLEDRDFYTEIIGKNSDADFTTQKQKLTVNPVSVAVMADLGVMVPITKQMDLMVGAYFQMTCNNLKPSEIQDMGWRQTRYVDDQAYRNHTFMNTYAGEIASEYVQVVRPYQVGVKVGVSWHINPKQKPVKEEFERIQVCDTTITLALRADTIMKPQREAARQIVRLMQKSVIWFDLDSYKPILQPADIVDRIAEILIQNPDQHILVNGHASREGNAMRNQRLSENRAKAVAELLLQRGVSADQIQVRGLGTTIDYQVEDGREHTISLDRRVEIIPVEL